MTPTEAIRRLSLYNPTSCNQDTPERPCWACAENRKAIAVLEALVSTLAELEWPPRAFTDVVERQSWVRTPMPSGQAFIDWSEEE